GDCEDLASLLMSISLTLNFESRIVIAENEKSGHVWTEVLISRNKPQDKTLKILNREFNSTAFFVKRKDGYWLQLEKKKNSSLYKEKYFINKNLQLHKY
ncbi:hypothetical protein ThvES_00020160, partial [Thiovulum sp. ES]